MMELQENKIGSIVNAKDIQHKIQNGEDINCVHKIIHGDLNLGLCNVPKIFERYAEIKSNSKNQCRQFGEKANFITSKINIINCSVNGNMNFDNSIFYNSINFENCIFKKIFPLSVLGLKSL